MKSLEAHLHTTFSSSQQRAFILLLFTATKIEDYLNQLLKTQGLTHPQYNVMRILRGQKGNPMMASHLSSRMIHGQSNVTRLLDKLQEKGWVTRQHCTKDRRALWVTPTSEGLSKLEQVDHFLSQHFHALLPTPDIADGLNQHLDAYLSLLPETIKI
jgi:DNA-binding MarR family transcriptional regulator